MDILLLSSIYAKKSQSFGLLIEFEAESFVVCQNLLFCIQLLAMLPFFEF